jgi:hypothetical protein
MASAECGWGDECCKLMFHVHLFGCLFEFTEKLQNCAAQQGSAVSRLGNIGMDRLMSLWQSVSRVVRDWNKYVDIMGFISNNIMIKILSSVLNLCIIITNLISVLHLCIMITNLISVLHLCIMITNLISVLHLCIIITNLISVLYLCIMITNLISVLHLLEW